MPRRVEGLAEVRERLAGAAAAAGRDPSSITLVAVSKRQPEEAIRAAYDEGVRDFGESYAQELRAKAEALSDLEEIRWHFIGHLQRNKVRQVTGRLAMLQTLDSPRLVEELGRRLSGEPLDVLLEVSLVGEASKTGCAPDELPALIEAARAEPALRVRGLMAIPPWEAEPEEARRYFVALRELRDRHGGAALLPELSMGMSGDFEVAIEEGATIVRVGTAIFGPR